MAKRVNSAWIQGLDADSKQKVESALQLDEIILDRLAKILYNMRESKTTTVLDDYDSPSWSHKQAHINGQLDIIDKLIAIVSPTERGDHPKP